MFKFVPGKAPPVRSEPYPEDELGAHDRKTAKYFVAGGFFLVLGSLHMVAKNLPWAAEYLARTGYAGHLVRDLSDTHVMIVGGGTLLATGLCWLVLPRRGGADGRNGPGRDPGAACQRGLALQGRPRGRMDRPDQSRPHQSRHRPDDARGGFAVRSRRVGRWCRALPPAREPLLLRAPWRVARLLRGDAPPGLTRGPSPRPPGPGPGAGGAGNPPAPVSYHGRRTPYVRCLLAAARSDRAVGLAIAGRAETVRTCRLRRACARDAAGAGAGVPGRQRAARSGRRGR